MPDTAFGFAYDPEMDTFLAIASRREVREYTDVPIPPEIVHRILDAGRLSGSSQNKQQWEFVIVRDREALSEAVYAPANVRGATLVVALAGDDETADEATVKTFYKEKGRIRLQPENAALEPIYAAHVQILGKVVGVFREL